MRCRINRISAPRRKSAYDAQQRSTCNLADDAQRDHPLPTLPALGHGNAFPGPALRYCRPDVTDFLLAGGKERRLAGRGPCGRVRWSRAVWLPSALPSSAGPRAAWPCSARPAWPLAAWLRSARPGGALAARLLGLLGRGLFPLPGLGRGLDRLLAGHESDQHVRRRRVLLHLDHVRQAAEQDPEATGSVVALVEGRVEGKHLALQPRPAGRGVGRLPPWPRPPAASRRRCRSWRPPRPAPPG